MLLFESQVKYLKQKWTQKRYIYQELQRKIIEKRKQAKDFKMYRHLL